MTELEKMTAGMPYDTSDPFLAAARTKAHDLCVELNVLKESDGKARAEILARLLPHLGEDAYIQGPFYCDYGFNIKTGARFYANFHFVVLDCAPVTIGDDVMIGPNVSLYTAYHPLDYKQRNMRRRDDGSLYDIECAKPITIGSSCWLAGGVTVLPGIAIGEGSVIGAGSVVTKDIPAHAVAVGNPCRVIKML